VCIAIDLVTVNLPQGFAVIGVHWDKGALEQGCAGTRVALGQGLHLGGWVYYNRLLTSHK